MKVKLHPHATAKEKCEVMAEAQAKFKKHYGDRNVIGTTEAWLLKYGREFTFRPRPEWLPRMTPNLCFFNSMALVMSEEGEDHGLTYCEGYVTDPNCPLNIHHAWTVNAEGIVVDPTLPEEAWDPKTVSYFGVNVTDTDLLQTYFAEPPDKGCLLDYRPGQKLIEDLHAKGTLNAR